MKLLCWLAVQKARHVARQGKAVCYRARPRLLRLECTCLFYDCWCLIRLLSTHSVSPKGANAGAAEGVSEHQPLKASAEYPPQSHAMREARDVWSGETRRHNTHTGAGQSAQRGPRVASSARAAPRATAARGRRAGLRNKRQPARHGRPTGAPSTDAAACASGGMCEPKTRNAHARPARVGKTRARYETAPHTRWRCTAHSCQLTLSQGHS